MTATMTSGPQVAGPQMAAMNVQGGVPTQFVMCQLHNVGDKPFSDRFNGTPFLIGPGQWTLVPFEALITWFGDPRTVDRDLAKDRTGESERIRARWGAYEHDKIWAEVNPKVKIFDATGTTEMFFLAQDMDGSKTQATTTPANLSPAELMAMFEQQQAQLDQLRRMIFHTGAAGPSEVAVDGETDPTSAAIHVPTEGPAVIPKGQGGPNLTVTEEAPEAPQVPQVAGRVPKPPAMVSEVSDDLGEETAEVTPVKAGRVSRPKPAPDGG